jgi:hypothetical protein
MLENIDPSIISYYEMLVNPSQKVLEELELFSNSAKKISVNFGLS